MRDLIGTGIGQYEWSLRDPNHPSDSRERVKDIYSYIIYIIPTFGIVDYVVCLSLNCILHALLGLLFDPLEIVQCA